MLGTRKPTFPADWSCVELHNVAEFALGKTPAKSDYLNKGEIKVIKFRDVKENGTVDFNCDEDGWLAADVEGKESLQILEPETILLSAAAHSTEHIGRKAGIVRTLPKVAKNFCYVGELMGIRSRSEEVSTDWLFYFLQSAVGRAAIARAVEGAHLTPRPFGKIDIAFPNRDQQQSITATIVAVDEAIQSSLTELEATNRLKKALMQQLFTRGMPGRHKEFKATKIGEVPVRWAVKPLKELVDIESGITLNQDRAPNNNPCRYLTVVNVQRGAINLSEVRHLELRDSEDPTKLLAIGDLLVVEGHANSTEIGRAAMVKELEGRLTFQNHLFRLRPKNGEISREFLLGVLNSSRIQRHWNAVCNTSSGLNTINRRNLRKLLIQVPEVDEQQQIVDTMATAENSSAAAGSVLESLQQLKKSLLQNLLTGKVRIKPAVIRADLNP